MLSAGGNPTLDSLLSVTYVLGLGIRFEPLKDRANAVATVSPTLVETQQEPEQFQPAPDKERDKGITYESTLPTNELAAAA